MSGKTGGGNVAEKVSALAVLDSLDVDELDALAAEKRRELEAIEVLAKAARVRKFGAPKKGPKAKSAARAEEPAQPPAEIDKQLKVRIVQLLRTHSAARSDVIAEQLGVSRDAVEAVLRNDTAFERKGPGYWYLT